MTNLSLHLFDNFAAELDDQQFEGFRSTKAQALLIYLASEPGAHERQALMELLWPGLPEESARTNLRQIVYQLRKAIPEVETRDGLDSVPLILSERQTVQLNPDANVATDAVIFSALLETVRAHKHGNIASCTSCQSQLEEAVALYQGSFLADFYLEDSDAFEEWAQRRRDAYRHQAMDALAMLAEGALRQGAYSDAENYARRQLELDQLDERATRQLMEALARDGRRHEALAVYEEATRVLRDELGMAPAAQTTRLAEQIESDSLEIIAPKPQAVRGYKLLDEIGAGAFGVAHRAYQPVIGREVVIKIIRPRYANHPDFIRRFEAEAQTIARLEHPYIVPLYDYWREPDNAYLVMRWLRGGNLEERLQDTGPLTPVATAGVVDQIAAALYAAHRRHIIHRDVKAANILLDEDDNAYLSDFSVAKDLLTDEEPFGLAGSPAYLSPEQLLKEELSPQADQYSLGILIYQMLTGKSPFLQGSSADILRRHILSESLPLVASQVPGMPGTIDDVLQRATAKKPGDRFPDMIALARAFQRAVGTNGATVVSAEARQLAGEAVEAEAAVVLNPYKGLRAFQESDAGTFFGREALVARLVGRLEEEGDVTRFLAVVGPSGSGKSSAVKAGLIPALRGGVIPGSQNWFITEMTPGRDPMEELAVALLRVAVDPPANLREIVTHDERGLTRILERILPLDETGETPQLLLLIDQFEELFTLTADDEARDFFINTLLIALSEPDSRLRTVATLRADFYDRPLQISGLGELLRERTEVVLPLSPAELERAITQPAALAGVALEVGLLAGITADVSDQPGTLPLMQYALTELFERRVDEVMTVAAYQEIGGVSGALGRRADEIYQGLAPAEQEAARQMFLRLVTLGEGVEDTRRRVLREELEALDVAPEVDMGQIIDTFGQYRLLTFDRDPTTRGPTVEVAHEALLRESPHLREWLDESRADVRLQRLLAGETAEWQKTGQDASYLLRGARLDQYDGWPEEANVSLTEEEKTFLAASFAARETRLAAEEARRQRELETVQERAEEQAQAAEQLRRRAIILAGALGIAALLAIAAFFFANQSSRNAVAAELNAVAAQENAELAATREAEAVSSEQQALANEARAEENAQLAQEAAVAADAAAVAESQAAEKALAAQQVAEEEAQQRATAEAVAIVEREAAEENASLARSRELAAQSTNNLNRDPELALLLAREGMITAESFEARNALHAAVLGSRLRRFLRAPTDPDDVDSFSYNLSGDRIITTADYEMVKVWQAESGELLFETAINPLGWWLVRAFLSPDGARLATVEPGDDFRLVLWDTDTWEQLEVIELPMTTRGMGNYALSPDWSQVVVSYEDGTATIWDLGSREKTADLTGHAEDYVETLYSPDGSRLVTAVNGDAVIVREAATGAPIIRIALEQDQRFTGGNLAISPDNRWLAFGDPTELWDLQEALTVDDPQPNATLIGHDSFIFGMAFSPDSRQLASVSRDQTARTWNVATGEPLHTLGHDKILIGVTFSPDGKQLLTSDEAGDVRFWDLTAEGASELSAVELDGAGFFYAVLSPDDTHWATTHRDGTARIWDVATGEELHLLEGHEERITKRIAFDTPGERLVTASTDGTARVWDMATGEELLVLEGHGEGGVGGFWTGVLDAAFHPDGQTLVTASADGTARIWDATTGEELRVLEGHTAGLTSIAFSPDGDLLATGSDEPDVSIKIWDPASGEELFSLPPSHGDRVWGLAFSPDGQILVSAGDDIRLWDLSALAEGVPGALVPTMLILPDGDPAFSSDGSELFIDSGGLLHSITLDDQQLLDLAGSRITRGFSAEECTLFNIAPCAAEG